MLRVGAQRIGSFDGPQSGGITPARVALRLHIEGPFTQYGSQGAT